MGSPSALEAPSLSSSNLHIGDRPVSVQSSGDNLCETTPTDSSFRSRTRWTGSPLEITSPIVSVMSIKTHGPRQKLTEVRVGSRGRGWRGFRRAHGVEQRGSHEPDLVNLCAGAGASDILFFEVAQSCALVLTREGPLVAID